MAAMEKVGDYFYDFTEVNLPSGQNLTIGVESNCFHAVERDLFALSTLVKLANSKAFKKIPINKDTTLTTVSCAMNVTNKMLILAMPNKESFQLSEDDRKAIEKHLRARLNVNN